MNVFGRASQRWNKGRKRGVSPIIATILLVAITVVLAAVLYVLISGLVGSTASAPITLAPSVVPGTPGGNTSTWYVPVGLTPSASIATTTFGLKITTTSGTAAMATAAVGSNCKVNKAYTAGTTCAGTGAAGWYGVLTASNGTIMALYTSSSGTGTWSASVTISGGAWTVNIITPTQYDGNGYTLTAYGTGSTSVSGQVSL
jgi:flagellin-like protein